MAAFLPDLYQAALRLLVEAREDARLSPSELSAQFGLGGEFVASYERGERLLDVGEFIAICRAIEADPYDLLRQAEGDG